MITVQRTIYRKAKMALFVLPITLLLLLLSCLLLPIWTVSAIDDPDTAPTVNSARVYTDCLVDGDIGVLISYYLDYTTLPNESANESYLAVFYNGIGDVDGDGDIDIDDYDHAVLIAIGIVYPPDWQDRADVNYDGIVDAGDAVIIQNMIAAGQSTQIKSVSPYHYIESAMLGYRLGMAWLYLDPSEVTDNDLDIDNIDLYKIWLMGNPTVLSGWDGDPPKTVSNIDYWQTTGDTSVLLALQILVYAAELQEQWPALDIITDTTHGNKLGVNGVEYFTNVIPDLKDIAISVFADSEYSPDYQGLDFTTTFGATVENGTGTVVGSPITLSEGGTMVSVTGTGTFLITLNEGTTGAVTGYGSIIGPVTLTAGVNTVTAVSIGLVLVEVNLTNTQAEAESAVSGTAFDLDDPAAAFGLSTMWFSTLVWMVVSILVCAAAYRVTGEGSTVGGLTSGKVTLLVFDLCIIGGAILGLVSMVVAVLLFLFFGIFIGYILFFRAANV